MKEITSENLPQLQARYKATVTVVILQIILTIIGVFGFWFFAPAAANKISQQSLITLWVAAVFLAIGALILRRLFYGWERLKNVTLLKGISGLLKNLQNNAILLSFFPVLMGIVGCLAAFLSGEPFEALRIGIAAVLVFIINFPRQSVWEKIVAVMEKV